MKKSFYLLLILALPLIATAQTNKNATTTNTTTTVTTTPAQKPAGQAATMPVPSRISFQTFVMEKEMMLNGDFQIGKDYVLVVKDDKKNTLFIANFNAQSNAQNVTLEKPLPKGAYVISLHEKNNELATGTINLVLN